MPKLRAFSGAELCNFLSEHGFERVRQRGSHVIMRRGQVSLPVPMHRQLDHGTLAALSAKAICRVQSSNDI
ncbi:MAG: type II toxin-antitoxin system HicA family toxin [Candidatus Udaeobacter sp.]